MNYRQTFLVVYGTTHLGPFEDEMEARTSAHAVFKTHDYVIINWLFPVDAVEVKSDEIKTDGPNG
jgi:hypothetical protein